MQRPIRTVLGPALVAMALVLASCSGHDGGMAGHDMSSTPRTSPQTSSSVAGNANAADVMFAQMMIPHHAQAVQMSDLLLKKSGVPVDVAKLATQIKAAQQPEITTMKGWLSSWGHADMPSGQMQHGGDDGMMTPEQLKQLAQADGLTGSKMYLEHMIKHHQGAITMAKSELGGGKNPDAIALANKVISSQQEEITIMQRLFKSH